MSTSTYEKDFYAWLDETIDWVRQGRFDKVDQDILIDELESMGKRDKRELASHLVILMAHLLKWQFQPTARSSGWIGSIAEQRLQIAGQLEDSPSLTTLLPETVDKAYPKAIALAAKETGLPASTFPPICPFSLPELTNDDYYPR